WKKERICTDKSCSIVNKKDAPEIMKSLALMHIELNRHKLQVYTDASKSDSGKLTAAFVIPELNQSLKLRLTDNGTVYSAELMAIKIALDWITKNIKNSRDTVIYTDSMSAIQSLESINQG